MVSIGYPASLLLKQNLYTPPLIVKGLLNLKGDLKGEYFPLNGLAR